MASAFEVAVAGLFGDPNLARPGTLSPAGGGASIDCRVMLFRPDGIEGWNGAQVVSDSVRLEIPVADVGSPAVGDVVTVDGVEYEIRSAPVRGPQRLVWSIEGREL